MTDFLVIESADGDVVEVEFASGLRTELPRQWFTFDLSEGTGIRVDADESGVRFSPDERAARFVRERNKQTLLDFHDEHD